MKNQNKKKVLIGVSGILFSVMFIILYRSITPQDRFFIDLKESDIERIILYNDRTRAEPVELTGNDRQEVVEQLLSVKLKGGWTVLDVQNGGSVRLYHIVLTDGREFDFGALPHHETGPGGTLRPCPYYIINGMRAYAAPKKNMELIEQINETWERLAEQYNPIN